MKPLNIIKHTKGVRHVAKGGFALVIALSLMAFVLLLLLSITTLVQVEQRSASISRSQLIARENAKLGAMVALGKLQQHLGADQRVSAPATLSEPTQTLSLFENRIRNVEGAVGGTWATYLDEDGQSQFEDDLDSYWTTRNPHWVGVWDSELKDGTTGDFNRGQLPVWLVSGNEAHSFNATDDQYPANYITPATALGDPDSDDSVVYLVGEGSSVQRTGSTGVGGGALDSIDGMDGRVKAKKVELVSDSGSSNGHFAYWVGDESQKANISLSDPYFNANEGTSDYFNRVLAPQRAGLERVAGYESVFSGGAIQVNDDRMPRLNSLEQAAVLDDSMSDPTRQNYHNLTVHSKGLFTDTARGGLRKDLTAYVESGSGLNDSDPIADPADYAGDQRFGLGAGFPSSTVNIPQWGAVRDWYQNVGNGGSLPVSAEVAPIVTMARLFIGFSQENGRVRMHLLPTFTLWNPYDVDLQATSYTLNFKYKPVFRYFSVGTSGQTDDTPLDEEDGYVLDDHFIHPLAYIPEASGGALVTRAYNYSLSDNDDQNDRRLKYDWEPFPDDLTFDFNFSAGFSAGESLVFSIYEDQEISNPHAKENTSSTNLTLEIDLENEFDADFPASAYFDMFEMVNPPLGGATVRYFTSISPQASDETFQLELKIGGTTVFASDGFGDINLGQVEVNAQAGERTKKLGAYQPSTYWRALPETGQFSSLINGKLDTNLASQPAFGVAMNYLQPFTMLPYRLAQQVSLAKFYRAFASYNFTRPDLSVHPSVDAPREMYKDHSSDGFDRFSFVASESYAIAGSSSAHNKGLPWEDDFMEFNSGTSSTNGFSLITPRFSGEFDNDQPLAIRQARRPASELASIGQLQQVNLSPFFWNPSFPVGNSEASPYVDRDSISGIKRDVVTENGAAPLQNGTENELLDISYLLNDSLWDRYFFSTVTSAYDFDDPNPLPNDRIKVRQTDGLTESDLRNFDTAAANVYNEGAFNVNSTSLEAWKALITGFRDLKLASANGGRNPDATVPVSRTVEPLLDPVSFAFDGADPLDYGAVPYNKNYDKVLAGARYLDDAMVDSIAQRIVDEVRLRGPFLSLADFVNRRLVAPDDSGGFWLDARQHGGGGALWQSQFIGTGYDPIVGLNGINGALQRAINLSGVNGGVNYSDSIGSKNLDSVYGTRIDMTADGNDETARYMQYASARHYLDTEHMTGAPVGEAGQLMSHAPGFVTQADLLAMMGSALTARGDTFVIRSYGDAKSPVTGESESEVWLETVVQRLPEPVLDTNGDLEPDDAFGRKFKVVSMRWLSEAEI